MANENPPLFPPAAPRRRIAIAGASGLIGRALASRLRAQGHAVVRLVRGRTAGNDEWAWNPAKGEIDPAGLEGVDAIVNLSGENVGAGRWTGARRAAILSSRIDATRTLVNALSRLGRKPAALVNASAVGFYGHRGDDVLTEGSGHGRGFLAEVCRKWETEAAGAERVGVRAVMLRFGVVLAAHGGALAKLRPLFRLGLGGRVGDGRQWMSWVSLDDAVGAIMHTIGDSRCCGALNLAAPEPVMNAEFTATFARVLRRPAVLPVPAAVLRIVFGEMADATILASTRAVPARLKEAGFQFQHPRLEEALRHVLGQPCNVR